MADVAIPTDRTAEINSFLNIIYSVVNHIYKKTQVSVDYYLSDFRIGLWRFVAHYWRANTIVLFYELKIDKT